MAKRAFSRENMVKFLTHHFVRQKYFERIKKADAAKAHKADFDKGWAEASVNERATFEFIAKTIAVPAKVPEWTKYEPLETQRVGFYSSKWFLPEDKGKNLPRIQVLLPPAFAKIMIEKFGPKYSREKAEFVRDVLGKEFGITPPKETA